jgi:diguanylate cyclase (GGDEF)-like protein
VGDEVLLQFTERCHRLLRSTDIICRYGGDEFAIVLPECNDTQASQAGERIVRSVIDSPFIVGKAHLKLSASIGIAILSSQTESVDDLIKQADQALLLAKKKGGGGIHIWKELSSE